MGGGSPVVTRRSWAEKQATDQAASMIPDGTPPPPSNYRFDPNDYKPPEFADVPEIAQGAVAARPEISKDVAAAAYGDVGSLTSSEQLKTAILRRRAALWSPAPSALGGANRSGGGPTDATGLGAIGPGSFGTSSGNLA